MAVGDRITGARTTGFMRRINALEAHPIPTATAYDLDSHSTTLRARGFEIDTTNGDIWIGGYDLGVKGHILQRSDLTVTKLIDTYPGSDTKFARQLHYFDGNLYGADVAGTKYRYSISSDTWTTLASADVDFVRVSVPTFRNPRAYMTHDGSDWYGVSGDHTIDKFNTSGVSQSTITLDEPNPTPPDQWILEAFGFDDDGNIVAINSHNDTDIDEYDSYISRYDSTGTLITGSFTGGADSIKIIDAAAGNGGDVFLRIAINASDGRFVISEVEPDNNDFGKTESYDKDGVEIGTIDVDGIVVSIAYYDSEIYVATRGTGGVTTMYVFDKDADLQIAKEIFVHNDPSAQTTWHRYPRHDSDVGKVSLGTPDAGVTIPSLTGLDGFRPHNLELNDMRDALETESGRRGVQVETGTTTSTTANKLVQTGQDFLTTVIAGDTVRNTTDTTNTTVSAVDSDTTLSLNDDIMVSGDDYIILSPYIISVGTKNIFRNAIDAGQDDWTTETVESDSRIKEDYYSDIDDVLTELESAEVLI